MTAQRQSLSLSQAAPVAISSDAPPDTRRIAVMTLAHFVNDSYGNYIAVLLPLLIVKLEFSLSLAGVLVAAYTITSSIVQPALGYVADRLATRVISVVGTMAAAVGASLLGLAPHYIFLVMLAVVSGLGTAAYHPQAAAMVVNVAGRRRATMMSLYLMGGNLGFAVGPTLAVWVVNNLGWRGMPLLAIPGLAMGAVVYVAAPRNWSPNAGRGGPSLLQVIKQNRQILGRLLGVVGVRSWGHMGLMAFLPIFLVTTKGFNESRAAVLVTVLLFTGAFGGVIGGWIADSRWVSRRTVIVVSLLAAGVFALAMLQSNGPLIWVFAVLTGLTLLGSFSVLTVKGQEVLPNNVGLASGFMLGLTIGLGGLGTLPLGFLADQIGLSTVIHLTVILPPIAALLALRLPD
jgi:FSR family fosmidomycin resistance protein-like MFS transporter